MTSKRWLLIVVICAVLTACGANGYSFNFGGAKSDSVKTYDKAHELYLEGKYNEAEKGYEEFIKNYPDSQLVEAALYYAAKCCSQQEEYDKALSYYKQLLEKYKEGFWVDSAKEEVMKIRAIQKEKEK